MVVLIITVNTTEPQIELFLLHNTCYNDTGAEQSRGYGLERLSVLAVPVLYSVVPQSTTDYTLNRSSVFTQPTGHYRDVVSRPVQFATDEHLTSRTTSIWHSYTNHENTAVVMHIKWRASVYGMEPDSEHPVSLPIDGPIQHYSIHRPITKVAGHVTPLLQPLGVKPSQMGCT